MALAPFIATSADNKPVLSTEESLLEREKLQRERFEEQRHQQQKLYEQKFLYKLWYGPQEHVCAQDASDIKREAESCKNYLNLLDSNKSEGLPWLRKHCDSYKDQPLSERLTEFYERCGRLKKKP